MALNSCILIKTTPLHTGDVLRKTREMTEVRKAFEAYGRYDLVVFASSADYSAVRKLDQRHKLARWS